MPTHEEGFDLVEKLTNVSFFKVGLELFWAGNVLGLIKELQARRSGKGGVFVDLKLSGDIDNTISMFIKGCKALNVKFITLTESVPHAITLKTIETALKTRGEEKHPKLLMVPLLSSLNDDDLTEGMDSTQYILKHGKKLLAGECDGLIVSGNAIKACRERFPNADIVSPGIRPVWTASDDHKRYTTPADAIRMGSDYLVVGRPITKSDPFSAAKAIIEEMDEALDTNNFVITDR